MRLWQYKKDIRYKRDIRFSSDVLGKGQGRFKMDSREIQRSIRRGRSMESLKRLSKVSNEINGVLGGSMEVQGELKEVQGGSTRVSDACFGMDDYMRVSDRLQVHPRCG